MLNSTSDMDIFPSTGQESMEKVVRMDKEMNKNHKAEIMTADATIIYRIATRLVCQKGLMINLFFSL
jgi:hypothetical protein